MILLTSLLLFFSSEVDYLKLSDKISSNFIKDVKRTKGFVCAGGGGSFHDAVNQISLSFF